MKKTYLGSCHCGAVRFEADIDLAAGTGKCNCTDCSKRRWWGAHVKPADVRITSGKDALGDYQFNTKNVHHRFCKTCGVSPLGDGDIKEMGGAFYSINLACLDTLDPTDLAAAPVRYMNGRDNDWMSTPAETRHL